MAKQLLPEQCDILHPHFPPPDCCICNLRKRIVRLEAVIGRLMEIMPATVPGGKRVFVVDADEQSEALVEAYVALHLQEN